MFPLWKVAVDSCWCWTAWGGTEREKLEWKRLIEHSGTEEINPACMESEQGERAWPGRNAGEESTEMGQREEEKVSLSKKR